MMSTAPRQAWPDATPPRRDSNEARQALSLPGFFLRVIERRKRTEDGITVVNLTEGEGFRA